MGFILGSKAKKMKYCFAKSPFHNLTFVNLYPTVLLSNFKTSFPALANLGREVPRTSWRRLDEGGKVLLQRVEQPGRRRARDANSPGEIMAFSYFIICPV